VSARRRVDLQGDLAVFAPEIVLQILSLSRVDGVLDLARSGEFGQVFLRAGKVVHVEVGVRRRPRATGRTRAASTPARAASTPEAASSQRVRDDIATLLGWRDGTFSFQCGVGSDVQGVPLDVEGLLLECMTRMDRVRGGVAEEQRG